MTNNTIITPSDLRFYTKISQSVSDKDVYPYIIISQDEDLRDILCDEFYNDFIINICDDKYKLLLNGGFYNYADRKYSFQGLKKVTAYYTYANYLSEVNMNSSAFGLGTKNYQDSTPVSYNQIKDKVFEYKNRAFNIFKRDVEPFLLRNEIMYPLYDECGCYNDKNNIDKFRFSKIDKKQNIDYGYNYSRYRR